MKKKSKKIGLILIPLVLIVLVVLSYIFLNKLNVEYKESLEVPLNTELYNTDIINNVKKGEIVTKKEKVDTSKVEIKKIVVKVKDKFNKEHDITCKLKVYDNEKPKIIAKTELQTYQNTKIDLLRDVKAEDNYDKNVKVTVEGKYDISKSGTYSLKYVAKDSSGNKAELSFILKVIPFVKDTNNYIKTTSKGYTLIVKDGIATIDGIIIANKSYSVPSNYGVGLTSEFMNAYNEMSKAAQKDGASIPIISGFRSYSRQQTLYNNYVAKDGKAAADRYSARPGHSEHQTGLGADLISIDYNLHKTKSGKWLYENAYKYGFILRYPEGKENITGYKFEPWHYRYVGKDLANKIYKNETWTTLEEYFGIDSVYKN